MLRRAMISIPLATCALAAISAISTYASSAPAERTQTPHTEATLEGLMSYGYVFALECSSAIWNRNYERLPAFNSDGRSFSEIRDAVFENEPDDGRASEAWELASARGLEHVALGDIALADASSFSNPSYSDCMDAYNLAADDARFGSSDHKEGNKR